MNTAGSVRTVPEGGDAYEQRVILGLGTGFKIEHAIQPANNGVEDCAYRSSNYEMRPEVVKVVGAKNKVSG